MAGQTRGLRGKANLTESPAQALETPDLRLDPLHRRRKCLAIHSLSVKSGANGK